jgi:hypothetical protein
MGDSLSKVTNRRTNVVQGVGDRDVRRGTNGRVVELIAIPNEHSNGLMAAYLPAEKIIYAGDQTVVNANAAQLADLKHGVAVFTRLNLDYNVFVPTHAVNPDRTLTKAEVMAAVNGAAN